jgi:hypothetical protein
MKANLIKQLYITGKAAKQKISQMTPKEKNKLEKSWDVEHAYYSSVLEGSKLDRGVFDKLAKKID